MSRPPPLLLNSNKFFDDFDEFLGICMIRVNE